MITFTAEIVEENDVGGAEWLPEGSQVVQVMMTVPVGFGLVQNLPPEKFGELKVSNENPEVEQRLLEFIKSKNGAFTETLKLASDPALTFPLMQVRGDMLGGGDLTVEESRKGVLCLVNKYFDHCGSDGTLRMLARVQKAPEAMIILLEEVLDQYKAELRKMLAEKSE